MSGKPAFFTAISRLSMAPNKEDVVMLHSNDLRIELSGNIDRDVYLDGKGLPRKAAMNITTQALVLGLICHVKVCVSKGWITNQEAMEYIISELGRAFAAPTTEDDNADWDKPNV